MNDYWVRAAAFTFLAVVAIFAATISLWLTGAIIAGTALALGEHFYGRQATRR